MSGTEVLFQRFGKECPTGTVLFRDGEQGSTMYVVQSGRIRISKPIQGVEKTLAILGPGEFFGELAILNNKPRTATAEVVEDARLLVLDAKTFEAMVLSNTEIALRLIHKMAQRLNSADELIEILMRRDPKARVILGLSREANVQGEERDDGSVLIRMNRHTLADELGLSEEEVSRVLGRLTRLSIVNETDEGFVITDRMRLHEFLEFIEAR